MEISGAIVFMRLPDKYVQLRSAGALPVYIDRLHFSARRLWAVYMRVYWRAWACTCVCVCRPQMAWWPWTGSPVRRWYIPKRQKTNQSFVDAACSSKPPNLWKCWSFEGDCWIFPHASGNASVLYALCLSWVPLHSNSLLWLILKRPGVISYTNKVPLKEIREICMNFSLIYLIIPHYKAA